MQNLNSKFCDFCLLLALQGGGNKSLQDCQKSSPTRVLRSIQGMLGTQTRPGGVFRRFLAIFGRPMGCSRAVMGGSWTLWGGNKSLQDCRNRPKHEFGGVSRACWAPRRVPGGVFRRFLAILGPTWPQFGDLNPSQNEVRNRKQNILKNVHFQTRFFHGLHLVLEVFFRGFLEAKNPTHGKTWFFENLEKQ